MAGFHPTLTGTPKWLSQSIVERATPFNFSKPDSSKVLTSPDDIGKSTDRQRKKALAEGKTPEPKTDFYELDKRIAQITNSNVKRMLQALRTHLKFIVLDNKGNDGQEEVYAWVQDSIFDSSSGFKPEKLVDCLRIASEALGLESFILPSEFGLFFDNKTPFITGGKYILKLKPLESGERLPIIEKLPPRLAAFLDRSNAHLSHDGQKPNLIVQEKRREGNNAILDQDADYALPRLEAGFGDKGVILEAGPTHIPDDIIISNIDDAMAQLSMTTPTHVFEHLNDYSGLMFDPDEGDLGTIVVNGDDSTNITRELGQRLSGNIGVREADSRDIMRRRRVNAHLDTL